MGLDPHPLSGQSFKLVYLCLLLLCLPVFQIFFWCLVVKANLNNYRAKFSAILISKRPQIQCGNFRALPKCRMQSLDIIPLSMAFQFRLRFDQRGEPILIQAFGSQFAVEGLDERIVGRFARTTELQMNPVLMCPSVQYLADELRSVVHMKGFGLIPALARPSKTSTTFSPERGEPVIAAASRKVEVPVNAIIRFTWAHLGPFVKPPAQPPKPLVYRRQLFA